MYQLLKRESLKVSEFSVYMLLKEYFLCLIGEAKEIFKNDESSCILDLFKLLVDFSKLTLQEISIIAETNWLPKGKLLFIIY